jgi:3-aminobutyryl-CoA ammonia-lyase
MSAKDAHYGGNLVDGAHMVHLFGDVATELLIKQDGDEGLFCAYDMVEFKAPVYAGDYIEAYGEITHVGNTSRKMKFEAYKVIRTLPEISASAAEVLEERILVARATGTCVTPMDCQRYNKPVAKKVAAKKAPAKKAVAPVAKKAAPAKKEAVKKAVATKVAAVKKAAVAKKAVVATKAAEKKVAVKKAVATKKAAAKKK